MKRPVRLRDFIEDGNGWLYAVSTYDNDIRVGCLLRYIPDARGERVRGDGRRYHKLEFDEAFDLISRTKPAYSDMVQRIPLEDVRHVLKPENEIERICSRNPKVRKLVILFSLPQGTIGCTGSFLCGLENESSDIDLVVYGEHWFSAQRQLKEAIARGTISDLSDTMWHTVYEKRKPSLSFETFLLHEKRKWNRGEVEGTYFDLLFTRSYENLSGISSTRGMVLGKKHIEATVTDATLSFDSPAVYEVDHEEINKVLSFTHTYAGQALKGEVIEAKGVCEEHGSERWLVIGTSRIAPGEFIISRSLMEQPSPDF